VFGVDGDEVYDPRGLERVRQSLRAGAHADCWRIVGHTLHCERFDEANSRVSGFDGPPSRTATKLYNFAALESWTGGPQRLHGGTLRFRPGFTETRQYRHFEHANWDQSDFRCLHMAFVPRSSLQDGRAAARPNVTESWGGGWSGRIARALAALTRRQAGSGYKDESYRKGPLRTASARAFFQPAGEESP
jgi:hypothetical protein